MRASRSVLSIAMAQTQIEQMISPSMTTWTIQWAFQNRLQSDRSEETSPWFGTTLGAINYPFGCPGTAPGRCRCGTKGARQAAQRALRPNSQIARNSEPSTLRRASNSSANLAKLGHLAEH